MVMASHDGLLSASKEVVLEIQLNKLINDFLFSGVENANATGVGDAKGLDDSGPIISSHGNPSWNMKDPSRKMDNLSCISLENNNVTENVGTLVDASLQIPANAPPKVLEGSNCIPSIRSIAASLPTLQDVRLDMPEQKSSSCSDDKTRHSNNLKVFRLSRAHSEAGSLFCFAMERLEKHSEKREEEKDMKSEKSSIKLTRIGSLPCHSKLHSEAVKEVKHTCRKPPRPPRPSSGKGAHPLLSRHTSADAIFVLHSASRRARLERRRRHAASSSSNASMWALIFTICFAIAIIGEGLWSQSSAVLAVDANINTTSAHSGINLSMFPSSLKAITQDNLHVLSQLEKEMQMREFWISKGLDPS